MNNSKTLLVDGSYLFKRSIFGGKNLYGNYKDIGGLYTFLTTIRKLIKEVRANKVVICWDGENSGKLRYLIDENYKANRETKSWHKKILLTNNEIENEEKNKSDLWQKKRIQSYLEELFIRQIEIDEIEADDLIAYYCKVFGDKENITIYTNDRDMVQLLNYYDVFLYLANKDVIIDKLNFFMHFDYHYSNSLTMKIICGDSSDNVKGIEGIQEKTLLKYFPKLKDRKYLVNEIITEAKRIQKERISENKKPLKVLDKIITGKKIYLKNKKLMDLSEPLINKEVKNEFKNFLLPLDDEDRNSKNLIKLMKEDGFLNQYQGNFTQYVEPFFNVIVNEKKILKQYTKNN
ncbi:MAG: hypothetical protein ACOC33_01335 [bacterium]